MLVVGAAVTVTGGGAAADGAAAVVVGVGVDVVGALLDEMAVVLDCGGALASRRQPSQAGRYTRASFGYGRERYVYAFVVSIVLFSIGGLFALYEAWHKWRDPHPIESWQWVPIAVLLVAMLMEGYALRTAAVESNRVRGGRSWNEFVRTA